MSASKLFTLHPFTFSFKRIVFFCKTASTSGFYSTSVNLSSLKIESISYKSHGVPSKVLNLETSFLPSKFDEHSVLVKLLAAPVNPSDINQIEGVYAILPKLPAVGGNEGVGEVLQIGSKVTSLQVGDWVVPAQAGSGTWRTHMLGAHNEFTRIPNDLSLAAAATISVNPCTAFRMLSDFVVLREGDYVIQNGATSIVGQFVMQIAAFRGIKTINIIRPREKVEAVKSRLTSLGATHVFTEEEILLDEIKCFIKALPKAPLLGLNCVGGQSSSQLVKFLGNSGTLVTYGGMSKQPVTVSTSSLIFKNTNIKGFWISKWTKENPPEARREMLREIAEMYKKKILKFDYTFWDYKNFKDAISASLQGNKLKKNILTFKKASNKCL